MSAEVVIGIWKDVRTGLINEVEKIPDDQFSFRATPETRSIAEILQHLQGDKAKRAIPRAWLSRRQLVALRRKFDLVDVTAARRTPENALTASSRSGPPPDRLMRPAALLGPYRGDFAYSLEHGSPSGCDEPPKGMGRSRLKRRAQKAVARNLLQIAGT